MLLTANLDSVFNSQASEAEPLFLTKYEGAWPLHLYLKRFLRKRVLDASANSYTQAGGGQNSASAPFQVQPAVHIFPYVPQSSLLGHPSNYKHIGSDGIYMLYVPLSADADN